MPPIRGRGSPLCFRNGRQSRGIVWLRQIAVVAAAGAALAATDAAVGRPVHDSRLPVELDAAIGADRSHACRSFP